MINFLKNLFQKNSDPEPGPADPDYVLLTKQIKKKEEAEDIQLGGKIHEFNYGFFTLRLDRDITKNYRITVFQGNDRIYSFTVFAEQGEYAKLEKAYPKVITFLKGEQKIAALPDSDLLKGFYFGH